MTYSIIAFDAETQEIGIGVQTHQPGVGAVVPWVKWGVGAVATQAMVNLAFGPQGLALLETGLTAQATLDALLAADPDREVRQVAVMTARGEVVAHTGATTIPHAGHRLGDGYSVQANMMLNDTVPVAMATAYESATGPLVERILATLEAAEAEGGDIRGMQSAAIRISGPAMPRYRETDVRIDNSAAPLAELRRLVDLYEAQKELLKVTAESLVGRPEAETLATAMAAHAAAQVRYPSDETTFWFAVRTLHPAGFTGEAAGLLGPLFERAPQWRELLHRLQMPGLEALRERFPV